MVVENGALPPVESINNHLKKQVQERQNLWCKKQPTCINEMLMAPKEDHPVFKFHLSFFQPKMIAVTRWFSRRDRPWSPNVGGHLSNLWKCHITIPKGPQRSRRIARCSSFLDTFCYRFLIIRGCFGWDFSMDLKKNSSMVSLYGIPSFCCTKFEKSPTLYLASYCWWLKSGWPPVIY